MDSFFVRARQYRPGDSRLGRSFALDPATERGVKDKHLALIQSLAEREVSADDVAVRGMLLCNSQRDYYYSRFSRRALDEVAEMLPGAPVMIGHDYSRVPIGRFFDSRVVRIEDSTLPKRDQYWVEGLYYAPRDDEGDAFIRRVDLGVWKEVSIGFRLSRAPCSICHRPIWSCEHIPGDIYPKGGICEWGMEGITAVLEGSQVFRGGQKDTAQFIPDGYGPEPGAKYRSGFVPETGDFDGRMIAAVKRVNWLPVVEARGKSALSVEEFLGSGLGQRAVGFGAMFGRRGERSNTQAIRCGRSRFGTATRAARWVRDHDFAADERVETESDFVFAQFAESLGEPGSFRNITLDDAVVASVCRLRPPEENADAGGRSAVGGEETVEAFLSRGGASTESARD